MKKTFEITIDVDWFSAEYLETLLKMTFHSNERAYNIKVKDVTKNK